MTTRCEDCDKGHCDRWNHLVDRVRASRSQAMVVVVDDAILMIDDEVPRCTCGGMFQPNAAGNSGMVCDCCGATWDFGGEPSPKVGSPPDEEVGKSLTEVLLARRRRSASNTWTPSDDDVKVTVHDR